jgi:formylglycine-generating enzyme required for sulfatase activity
VDMAGNVWEWTASDYGKNCKVLRGGAWRSYWTIVRAAPRYLLTPASRYSSVGFRCVGLPGG